MKIVVPIAGPDFEGPNGTVKAEHFVDGRPLLRAALESRPWWGHEANSRDVVFILKDSERSRRFRQQKIDAWYPESRVVFTSHHTNGAAFSALAGVALFGDVDEAICIDLVDILYASTFSPRLGFKTEGVDAVALTFKSSSPIYSYLRTDAVGQVVEAAEKRVISNEASAGTYFFASTAVYLRALAHNLDHRAEVTHLDRFFVCPLFNGVLDGGGKVLLEPVTNIIDVKDAAQRHG